MPEAIWIVISAIAATLLLRFAPFVLFKDDNIEHPTIKRLGETLPGASIGLLVVYVFADVSFEQGSSFVSEMIAVIVIVLVHQRFKSPILSMMVGTSLYIIFKTVIF
ncbi:MAG: AzlD domain-containing protein [Acholeplasmataceae bacterium]|nr:AzlD domain-containing protein [Acholeplasmataceae bacterium]